MKSKLFAIIGAFLFIASVIVGQFAKFEAADVVELALACFALVSVVWSIIKKQKEAGTFSWVTILIICLDIIGAALVCLGGVSSNVFEQISGLVIAILSIILGFVANFNSAE